MAYEQIEVRDDGLIRTITLNRPARLNAWTRRMSREMVDAIVAGNDDPAIGAFVFTGAGRGFCAGADIGDEFATGSSSRNLDGRSEASSDAESAGASDADSAGDGGERRDADWVELIRASKPMVAAVNGPAVGVGLTMILPMDYLVAGASARLSARFVKMGVVPELASSHFLVQRCGWGAASDLALSGRIVDAAEAATIGLVDRVVDDDALLETATAHAMSYAENGPETVRMIKDLLTANGTDSDLAAVQRRELDHLRVAMRSPEHREAIAAFVEKREPRFR